VARTWPNGGQDPAGQRHAPGWVPPGKQLEGGMSPAEQSQRL